jgi:hypothetical protein
VKELRVALDDRTVLIGMKPDPSVGMSAKNSTFTAKLEQVPAGSTTFTARPIVAETPVGGVTNVSPPAVMVAVIRIGTPVCVMLVSGFVQLVVPSHCIDVPVADVNDSAWDVLSRPAVGNALDDEPQ